MRKEEFEIVQCHTGTLMLVWLGGLAAILFLATKGMDTLLPNAGETVKTASLVVFALIGYGAFRWGKKASATPTQVVVDEAGITILDRLKQESRQLLFENIAAYKHSNFNNVEELQVTMKNGLRYEITINTLVHRGQTLGGVVAAFETALEAHHAQTHDTGDMPLAAYQKPTRDAAEMPLAAYQKRTDEEVRTTLREKTFFEKPISTVVLVVFTVFLVWAALMMLTSSQRRTASLIGLLGGYFAYVAGWLAARARRNET